MNFSKQQLVRSAQLGTLVTLFWGQLPGNVSLASDFQHAQVIRSNARLAGLTAKAIPISEADADAIEKWLVGDINQYIFGLGGFFFGRAEVVLAQPNAKTELARIVARKDLPPHLRVYAQEMLMKAGQLKNPSLVEDYCYTLQNSRQIRLLHGIWGLPGVETGGFGETLTSYHQAALPCLSRLLNNNNELSPGGNGEWNAVASYMQYRIADLAAYFITQILDLPYNDDPNPAVRDQQIQDLQRRLGVPSKAGENSSKAGENEVAPIGFSTSTAIDELIFSGKNLPSASSGDLFCKRV